VIILVLAILFISKKLRIKVMVKKINSKHHSSIKTGAQNRFGEVLGKEVYSLEGEVIGVVEEIYLNNNSPKVYGWVIKIKANPSKGIESKRVLIKHEAVFSIDEVMIIDKNKLKKED